MRETKNGEAKKCKHTCFAQEGHGPQGLLHEDLGDRGQVVVRVVGHHDAREQDGHDARERDSFCEPIRKISKNDHHAKLQGRRFPQVNMLQHQCRDQAGEGAERCRTKEHLQEVAERLQKCLPPTDI